MIPSITQSDVLKAVGDFLVTVLPSGFSVIQALDNLVAPPVTNYAAMQIVTQSRLATNIQTDTLDLIDGDYSQITQKTEISIQVDIYSETASNQASVISTLFRDAFAYDSFPENIKPLYCDDPKQIVFVNDAMQYEKRFMIMLYLQYDPTVTVNTQLAVELNAPTIYPVIEGVL
jgi:hypothetical protein